MDKQKVYSIQFSFIDPSIEKDLIYLQGKYEPSLPVILLNKYEPSYCRGMTGPQKNYVDEAYNFYLTQVMQRSGCGSIKKYSVAVLGYELTTYQTIPLIAVTNLDLIQKMDQTVRSSEILNDLLLKDRGGRYSVSADISTSTLKVFSLQLKNAIAYILEYHFSWKGQYSPLGPRVMVYDGKVFGLTGQCSFAAIRAFQIDEQYYLESGSFCCECGIHVSELFRITTHGVVRIHVDYSYST